MRPILSLVASVLWGAPLAAAALTPAELYQGGAEAYGAAPSQEPIELLGRAHRIEPHAELAYDLGRAYEGSGDLRRAADCFREYLRLDPRARDRAAVEARIQSLQERLDALRPRLTISSNPDGARIAIDGAVVGTTPWTGALSAGAHHVALVRSGCRAVHRDITLTERQRAAVSVELTLHPAPIATAPTRSSSGVLQRVKVPTWIAFGVGVGVLGTAVGFEVASESAQDGARRAVTQVAHQGYYQSAERDRDMARALAGVGAAAVVTGGVLLYLDLSSGPPR